jgi:hypothetical protein
MTPLLASGPVRMFRLSNDPGERGLSCTPDGVALAGIPPIRKTQVGFVPRPADEIASLRSPSWRPRKAYGSSVRVREKYSGQSANYFSQARLTLQASATQRSPALKPLEISASIRPGSPQVGQSVALARITSAIKELYH